MQNHTKCTFCGKIGDEVEDSIEHYVYCEAIRNALGPRFHNFVGLTPSHWFLLAGSQKFRRGMLFVLNALYTWFNIKRHQPWL